MPPRRPDATLAVSLGPLTLAHPLINASGTLDLFEVAESLDPVILTEPPVACYVPKTVTLEPRRGNEAFIDRELPRLLMLPCPLILNVGGFAAEEYGRLAARLRRALDILMPSWSSRIGLELNVSCPNVHSGCISIGSDPSETRAAVEGARAEWPGLLVVKLTPNIGDILPVARAAVEAGAGALALVNTFKGLALDRVSLRPFLGGVTGGLSGPAIKPLALRFVYEVAREVDVPLIGMGGVASVQDVLDFLACGATVVAVGAAGFRDPWLPARLTAELATELHARGWNMTDVVGRAHA
jgi:dihydroorotate dehydrogenase (NAD+) catalytic subunit